MIELIEISGTDKRAEKLIPLIKKLDQYQIKICPLIADFIKKEPYDKSSLEGKTFIVAYDDDYPIGYLSYNKFNKNSLLLYNLFIDEKYRSKGIGGVLVKTLKNRLTEKVNRISVGTLDNPSAVKFYQSHGFKIVDCQGYIDVKRHSVSGDTLTFKERSKNSFNVFLKDKELGYITYFNHEDKEKYFSIENLMLSKIPGKVNIVDPIKRLFPKVSAVFIYYYPKAYPKIKHNLEQLQFKVFGYDLLFKK